MTASRVVRVISGGQTGVDRAALDAALAVGLPIGGTCPRGRRAEDGVIPERYPLIELDSAEYADRTRANVVQSSATLILSPLPLAGGTALTCEVAREIGVPLLTVDPAMVDGRERIAAWLGTVYQTAVDHDADAEFRLNVAGPRESESPGIGDLTRNLLIDVFREWIGPDDSTFPDR